MRKARIIGTIFVIGIFSGIFSSDLRCAEASQGIQGYEKRMAESWELLRANKFKKAIAAFEKIDESIGGDDRARLGLATAHYHLRRYAKSLKLARSILEITQNQSVEAGALHLLGLSLYMMHPDNREKLQEANRALRREIEILGETDPAIGPKYSLAKIVDALGDKPEAIEILRDLLKENHDQNHPTLDKARVLICQLRQSVNREKGHSPRLEGDRGTTTVLEIQADSEVEPPQKLFAPPPGFTSELRKKRRLGTVLARVIIDEEGCLTHVEILDSFAPEAEMVTNETLPGWVYKPATLNGRPVAVYLNVILSWSRK